MILARHGESEWNRLFGATRVDPGIPDPALTETGIAQAQRVAGALEGGGLRRIVTSPYRRALETAMVVAERLRLPVEVEPLVRERCAFSCDLGSPPGELARLWPELSFDHLDEPWWTGPEEPESALLARCAAFGRTIAGLPDREHVLVVSHWGFIRGMTGRELPNGGVVRLG
jgi:glucosyl-3-phosphoglycerate phosphatase